MIVEVLYPEVANLFGDLANIKVITESDHEIEVHHTSLFDRPLFVDGKADLVFMGSMTESAQEKILQRLLPLKDELWQYIESGRHMLVTGNAVDLFGEEIILDSGAHLEALGYFPFRCRQKLMARHNSMFLGNFNVDPTINIVGFRSQFSQVEITGELPGLFSVTRGVSFSGVVAEESNPGSEGIHYQNFMATNLLGPLLVINPLFAEYLLRSLGAANSSVAYRETALAAYELRLKQFRDPQTGFTY